MPSILHPVLTAVAVRRWGAAMLLAMLGGQAIAEPPLPQALRPVLEAALDNPREALAQADAAADSPDPEARFWRLLGKAAVYTLLDRPQDARTAVGEAQARLGRIPTATPRHHLWLEAYAIGAQFRTEDSARLIPRSEQLRRAALPLKDEYLLCEISVGDLFLLRDTQALDEAWRMAEETERCGRKLGQLHLETSALIAMGSMASTLSGKAPADSYFDRAREVLGVLPARFQRGWIEWEQGNALARRGEGERAARSFEAALAHSREIGDDVGQAIVTLDLAALRLAQGEPARVLELVRGVQPLMQGSEAPARIANAQGLIIEALARLKRAEVLAEIEKARALDTRPLSPLERARLSERMAEGYASQGLFAQAYAELQRSVQSVSASQQSIRDTQVLRLQARYEIARREAELADLRHRAEADRLSLQAREAQQRALWAALAALVGLLVVGAWLGQRALRWRRQRADMGLRDELTGAPNRRAVLAFAHEQFELCRRLRLEFSVALVDIDHFQQVNDRHGRAAGDRVLRALALSAAEVLRGQERIGRYAGDEWLMVMPGTAPDELPGVFEQLRVGLASRHIQGLAHPHGLTLSMGAATLADGIDSVDALVDEAQRQLNRAKAEGRDRLRHPARGRRAAAARAGDADPGGPGPSVTASA